MPHRLTVEKIKGLIHPAKLVTDPAYEMSHLKYAPEMSDRIAEVKHALEKGVEPEKAAHGSEGTYFLKSVQGERLIVFKQNEYALRECIAYRLDYRRFAGIPQTAMTTLAHPLWGGAKRGSCQLYVEGRAVVELTNRDAKNFSAESIRRIAALDIRLLNSDRHSSNMIHHEGDVIPIDHEFILRDEFHGRGMSWVRWEQSHSLFSREEKNYILHLDPEKDRRILLEEFHLPEKIGNRFYIASVLLQLGAARNFSAGHLGSLMIRKFPNDPTPSPFDTLLDQIKRRSPSSWTLFVSVVYEEVKKFLDNHPTYAADQ